MILPLKYSYLFLFNYHHLSPCHHYLLLKIGFLVSILSALQSIFHTTAIIETQILLFPPLKSSSGLLSYQQQNLNFLCWPTQFGPWLSLQPHLLLLYPLVYFIYADLLSVFLVCQTIRPLCQVVSLPETFLLWIFLWLISVKSCFSFLCQMPTFQMRPFPEHTIQSSPQRFSITLLHIIFNIGFSST